ncbi:alpha/beta hydrolase [Sphingomonas canadensis]|uniref:Alpha/beta hydrolase n=2 Tax=Sphingomonas canadensis TaxID=1219257 RepID=A0ABW3HAE9_9SPHN|nr:alpha/beta fold hydrolase [Sphingomonas canadensis]
MLRRAAVALAVLALLWGGAAAAQVTVQKIAVHGPSIEGNLEGNSADREVFVILPASYAKQPKRRYPVVYFLHGFTATAEGYMKYLSAAQAADTAFAKGQEMILVLPDSYTRHGGSMYSSSTTIGDFETFVARDLVAYIDGHYRTIAKRESRGLSGHSMGGYGTMRLAMKHPGVFSSYYAMSSCCLAPRTDTLEQAKAIASVTMEQALKGDFMVRAGITTAVAWSPAPDKPPFYADFPYKDGALDQSVFARWAANAPLAMLPQYVPGMRSITAMALDVGDKDFLLADNQALHAALVRYGVAHDWTVYDGDHGNRIPDRFRDNLLPFFQAHLKGM